MKQLVIDTWGKIVPLFLIVGLTLAVACSTSTDPDPIAEPEPILTEGTKQLTVVIIDRAEESGLTGYDIEITGPVTASAENVSTSEYVLEDLESGEYTIQVTLDGYVEASITEEFEVPEGVSDDYLAETTLSLRELTPPVKVDNSQPTTVQTGTPDEEDATEDEAVTLQIRANTFPAEVVNTDGTVDISVTRARASQRTAGESGGQVRESIILSPTADLNDTVTVTIPIREIEGLEGVEYELQPGNIPLINDNNGNLTAKIAPQAFTQLVNESGGVTTFGAKNVVATNVGVTETKGNSNPQTFVSECGEPLQAVYSIQEIPGFNPAIVAFTNEAKILAAVAASANISIDGQEDKIVSVQVSNETKEFTLTVNGEQRASQSLNTKNIKTGNKQYLDCRHNSGNNPG